MGEWRDNVAPLFVALHDLDLVHVLPRHGGGGGGGDEDGGEGKLGGFHVKGFEKRAKSSLIENETRCRSRCFFFERVRGRNKRKKESFMITSSVRDRPRTKPVSVPKC